MIECLASVLRTVCSYSAVVEPRLYMALCVPENGFYVVSPQSDLSRLFGRILCISFASRGRGRVRSLPVRFSVSVCS